MSLFTEVLLGLLIAAVLAAGGFGLAYKRQVTKNATLSSQVSGLQGALKASIEARAAADVAVLARDRIVASARPSFSAAAASSHDWSTQPVPKEILNEIRKP